MRNAICIRIGDGTTTIVINPGENPAALQAQIANMAATVAAGIEAGDIHEEWGSSDTVERALRIAVDIFIATRGS